MQRLEVETEVKVLDERKILLQRFRFFDSFLRFLLFSLMSLHEASTKAFQVY